MRFFTKHRYYLLFQAVVLILFVSLSIFSEAGLNDGDSITHYYISRYAWQYPHLFLDNWGKPFFILLSSPFAQFGYGGIQFFNVLCAVISSWFCYRVADKFGMQWAFAAPVFLMFMPVYLSTIPSGLTEILFGLVFILSIYLLVNQKFIASALIVSLLPFCRTEGMLIIPIFALFFFLKRKFAIIPLLLFGFLAYSCTGYFYYQDFLWILHTNPYRSSDVYGHGTLWFFFQSRSAIFSDLLSFLFALGTFALMYRTYSTIKSKNIPDNLLIECLVVWGAVIVYFTAHSIFWYKGLFGSAGMCRVMAAIAPAFALVALRGLTFVLSFFKNLKWLSFIIGMTLTAIVILHAVPRIPQYLSEGKNTVRDACDWVKRNGLQNRKIYYSEPFTKMCLSLDPYDTLRSKELMYVDRKNVGADMPPQSIIIWEPGLGPREDGIPLNKLTDNPDFVLLKKIEAPNEKIRDKKYTVYVFERK